MSLRINQNIDAFNSYRNLSVTQGQMSKSLEKLSSGFRINRAADDAAGLAISEGLRSQVGGLKVAVRNAQDGISVVQTAEGALTEVHSILQRMRDLAVQGANDTNSPQARAAIGTEVNQLQGELSRIAGATNFNGTKLLDGTAGTKDFQVGAGSSATENVISFNFNTANVQGVSTALSAGGGNAYAVDTPTAVEGPWSFTNGGVTTTVDMGAPGSKQFNTVQQVADKLNSDSGFASNMRASVNGKNELVVTSTNGGTVARSHRVPAQQAAPPTRAGSPSVRHRRHARRSTRSTRRSRPSPPRAPTSVRCRTGSSTPSTTSTWPSRTCRPPRAGSATRTWPPR